MRPMALHTESNNYRLETQGNGLFALLTRKSDGATVFFQGDDSAIIVNTANVIGNTLDSPEDMGKAFDRAMSDYDDIMS